MRSLEELDRWIATKVKRLSGAAPDQRELLEIRRDILEDVRRHIEPKGGGKFIFPYNEIAIRLDAPDAQREMLEAALCEEQALEGDIRELLNEAGCPVLRDFLVSIDLDGAPFGVTFRNRKTRAEQPPVAARPAAKLIVTKGSADPVEFAITANRINLGRLKEVVGEKDGLRRRNDLAFDASETTVSREHGYIRYDASSSKFRICDDKSARGISVFRDGRRIGVPRASNRGVQLHAGDEIHLGDACIKFEIEGS